MNRNSKTDSNEKAVFKGQRNKIYRCR